MEHARTSDSPEPPVAAGGPAMGLDGGDGVRLGAYRIESPLGQGGMGEVFLAWDERLERHVAIKRIRTDKPPDERHRARFRREARAVARLSHPSIVQVFDIFETEEGDCLVMERVEGESLAHLIARREVDLRLALQLATEIADGLGEAHAKGLVHRDLKPGNVIVTPAGHAKILDFGLARVLWHEEGRAAPAEASSLTDSGTLVGTVHAMSPEQASGRPVDHRSDLFALGSLLYEMLTGRPPFRGDNLLDTLRRVTGEEPPAIGELVPEVPAAVVDLVGRLLAKQPAERPQNARLVSAELEKIAVPASGSSVHPPRGAVPSPSVLPWAPDDPERLHDLSTSSGLIPLPPEAAGELASGASVIRVLVATDLVRSTRLIESLGDSRASDLSARHDRAARDLLARHGGLEIDKSDGFLLLFERPADALEYALSYHQALARLSQDEEVELEARVGIHLGEVLLRRNPPEDVERGAKRLEVEGLAKPTVARVVALAGPRQTLLTRAVFDLGRRSAADGAPAAAELRWLAHGEYVLEGIEEPVEIFEVGLRGFAPLTEPADTARARRAVALSDELTLGWRPAAGQPVPRRANWELEERIGEGGFGEVWLARHKAGEKRVFKFCFEASRLRALKREVTLFRLLKEALGHREDIARILDWDFDEAPYFLESEYTEGGNLVEWASEQGGVGAVALETRLELVAEIAEALAAAHSVGILHKDVKPENVLVTTDREGRPRARLTDFGIGLLTERERLEKPGVTALGFTETLTPTESSSTIGTLGYMAPEILEGHSPTTLADIFSLGVVLYQVVVADFSRTLASGWQRDVPDEILADDLACFVDGRPERRPASALEVARRLRTLEERRRARAQEEARRVALERAQRRRGVATAVAAVAVVFMMVVGFMALREAAARKDAEAARERAALRQSQAEDLIGFMLGDLRQKLAPVNRLEVLDEVGAEAMKYFASVPVEELSDEELSRRSMALYQIGDVRMRQGVLPSAKEAFQESLDLARALLAREPDNGDRLFGLGQSHFWLGSVFWMQGDFESALKQFEGYLAAGRALVTLDPDRADWRMELAFGHSNIGRVLKEQNDYPGAIRHFQQMSGVLEELVRTQPERADWKAELANSHLLVGAAQEFIGDRRGALEHFRANLEIVQSLVEGEPDHTGWKELLVTSHSYVGIALERRGDLDRARHYFSANVALAGELAAMDEENARWQSSLAAAELVLGRNLAVRGEAAGREHLETALALTDRLVQEDPSNHRQQREWARARVELASWLARYGEPEAALKRAREAHETLEGLVAASPEDRETKILLSECNLVRGEALAAMDDDARASAAWSQAYSVLSPYLAENTRLGHLLAPVARALLYLGQDREAKPILAALEEQGYQDQRLHILLGRAVHK